MMELINSVFRIVYLFWASAFYIVVVWICLVIGIIGPLFIGRLLYDFTRKLYDSIV